MRSEEENGGTDGWLFDYIPGLDGMERMEDFILRRLRGSWMRHTCHDLMAFR